MVTRATTLFICYMFLLEVVEYSQISEVALGLELSDQKILMGFRGPK